MKKTLLTLFAFAFVMQGILAQKTAIAFADSEMKRFPEACSSIMANDCISAIRKGLAVRQC